MYAWKRAEYTAASQGPEAQFASRGTRMHLTPTSLQKPGEISAINCKLAHQGHMGVGARGTAGGGTEAAASDGS